MPAAPCGAADARISRRRRAGLVNAICWTTKLPMEKEVDLCQVEDSDEREGVVGHLLDSDWRRSSRSAHSGVIAREDAPLRRRRVDKRRIPIVKFASEALQEDKRNACGVSGAGIAVRVVDAVGGADLQVRQPGVGAALVLWTGCELGGRSHVKPFLVGR
jgi:hypothetical protein